MVPYNSHEPAAPPETCVTVGGMTDQTDQTVHLDPVEKILADHGVSLVNADQDFRLRYATLLAMQDVRDELAEQRTLIQTLLDR